MLAGILSRYIFLATATLRSSLFQSNINWSQEPRLHAVWKGCLASMGLSRPRVALLIDGDNSASISIPSVLAEAGKLGDVMIRRVYGNWSLSSMHAWQEIAPRYGLEQRHHGQTTPGKNATDIALVVDAMDILFQQGDQRQERHNHFVMSHSLRCLSRHIRKLQRNCESNGYLFPILEPHSNG